MGVLELFVKHAIELVGVADQLGYSRFRACDFVIEALKFSGFLRYGLFVAV